MASRRMAMATRVQADRDVVIVSDARSKPLDPSLPVTPGRIPTTAKCGVDATLPDDVPRERYERIAYVCAGQVALQDVLAESGGAPLPEAPPADIAALSASIRAALEREPLYFAEIAERFAPEGFAAVTRALGELHAAGVLGQDAVGRHCLAGSAGAASPPWEK